MKVLSVVLLLELLFCGIYATHQGYKLYEITPQTKEDVDFLHKFGEEKFDIWREGRTIGQPTDIMVAPEDQEYFENELTKHGLPYEIVVEDVETILQKEKLERGMTRSLQAGDITFSSYMFLEEHMAYLRRLANDYSDIVTVESIGQSYEGRDILLLKLSSGQNSANPKPAIFIDAGIHCREWIAPPVALYAIHQLVENASNAHLYENIDWYILPNWNVDGYEYTTTENRLWRKNRRLTEGAACYGTDLNRNFGYEWMFGGASDNPCAETFAGPEPFSEPEAQAFRDWFLANNEHIKLYLSFHSFGELLLYPWSYDYIVTDNTDELYELAVKAVTAIENASEMGSSYYVNSSAVGLYQAAGVTTDWVYAEAGVELSYIYELPNGDAPYWFMIPARQILPVVRETWAGIYAMWEYIEDRFVVQANSSPDLSFILRKDAN